MTQRQEVNLYRPHLRPKIDYLSPKMVARAALVLVLGLLLTACFDLFQNYQINSEIAQREKSIAQLTQQVAQVKAQLPKSQSAKLDREIRNLRLEIHRRQAISRLIDGQSIGNTAGFSEQLSALGEKSSDKISLSGFSLAAGGDVVSMNGHTRTPESVPSYIDRLRQSESFSGSVFGSMSIARVNNQLPLSFSLKHDESGDDNHE
ncbi:MAG: hypothetical protein ACRBBW_04215 [Cellvibrionaceae bacterium]